MKNLNTIDSIFSHNTHGLILVTGEGKDKVLDIMLNELNAYYGPTSKERVLILEDEKRQYTILDKESKEPGENRFARLLTNERIVEPDWESYVLRGLRMNPDVIVVNRSNDLSDKSDDVNFQNEITDLVKSAQSGHFIIIATANGDSVINHDLTQELLKSGRLNVFA